MTACCTSVVLSFCAHAVRPVPPHSPPSSHPPPIAYQCTSSRPCSTPALRGSLLTEGKLGQAVGVSRTPVREALLKLEMEGLLKPTRRRAPWLFAVSAQEIADVVETRLLVEEFAVRRR
ncbi:GntR family transcriptional regulator [Streptomyces tanashiensis]